MSGYPRRELCPACERVEVDVIGPGDRIIVCHFCHLALASDPTYALANRLRHVDAHLLSTFNDPDQSDDAIADAILDLRRDRGNQSRLMEVG